MTATYEMPLASGDWEADCAEGRRSAGAIVDAMRAGVAPLALQQVARQLAGRTEFDGVACGFYAGLSVALM